MSEVHAPNPYDVEPESPDMASILIGRPQTNGTAPMVVRRSDKVGELVAALAKAQLGFKAVVKDAENPAYTRGNRRSMYATLDSVVSATRESLASNGLVIIALPQEMIEDRKLKMTSILFHSSEQFIESTLVMTAVEKVSPQELGKLITYARRYQWSALCGVAPEDDTDGNESSGVGSREAQEKVAKSKTEGTTLSLFYTHFPESNTYQITGAESLLTGNRDVLKPLWNKTAGACVANEEQIEGLKYTFEQRGIPFKLLKTNANT